MKEGQVRFRGRFDVFTLYLVPGATILLASLGSWTDTNLSVLGSASENQFFFGIWGIAIGIYYCIYMQYLFKVGRYRKAGGKRLVYLSAAFLFLAVMIPYLPREYPLRAAFHVFLAFFSPVFLTSALILFLRYVSSTDRPRFRRAWQILWILAALSLLFLLNAGFITSFLEVFIVVSLCGYLRYVERILRLQKRERR